MILKSLIIAAMLLAKLAIAQQSQQPSKKGWCPADWRESGSYCIR